jgi:hypothetical protein
MPGVAKSLHLQPATLDAWNAYVTSVEAAVDSQETLSEDGTGSAEPVLGDGMIPVPGGLIHHWRGTIFIPGAKSAAVLEVLRDYGRYEEFYRPAVVSSQVLSVHGSRERFRTEYVNRVLGITSAMDAEYESTLVERDRRSGYIVTRCNRLREIHNYDEKDQYELPPDVGSGYAWMLASVVSYCERGGGVYVELQAMELSRSIPGYLHWVAAPIVNRLSRTYVETTLEQTRQAIEAQQRLATVAQAR